MPLIDIIKNSQGLSDAVFTATGSQIPLKFYRVQGLALHLMTLAYALETHEPLIVVLHDDDRVALFERELNWLVGLENLGSKIEIFNFPDYDLYESDLPPAMRDRRRRRLSALSAVYSWQPAVPIPLVLATPGAVARRTMSRTDYLEVARRFHEHAPVTVKQFIDHLAAAGYQRLKTVEDEGSFCVRGGVIDVFPAQASFPVRVEFAGNLIDEMRVFDPESQRSSRRVKDITIAPCFEAVSGAPAGDMSVLRDDHRTLAEQGISFDGGILYPQMFGADSTILSSGIFKTLIAVDPEYCAGEFVKSRNETLEWLQKNEFPSPDKIMEMIYSEAPDTTVRTVSFISHDNPDDADESVSLPASMLPPLPLSLDAIAEKLRADCAKGEVVVISRYRKRLDSFLEEQEIFGVRSFEGDMTGGVSISDIPLAIYTDSEMFSRPPERRKPAGDRRDRAPILVPEDISQGEYVVHADHGVGIYEGIVRRHSADGCEKDFFQIKYGRGDALLVPVDQMNRIEKYIGGEGTLPRIYPLHSGQWNRVKQRVRKKVEELASKLLLLYQERAEARGFQFSSGNVFLQELYDSFQYTETEDQLHAIRDVESDMEGEKPMDRLVFGDVGYGKTEVAIRAAFKAALDHKQIAILCPTTVLAHQHYRTFSERLARFPVTVDVVSRFRSRKEQNVTLKRLASGDLDIIVGTHRLLSKDVVFKQLGLLIVDEEQRFGVKHKEAMKMLKTNIDVLTLTATPIPRTLNMAMAGIRDMSLIETPPEDRRSVRTFVEAWNTHTLYLAIERELSRRGQVFFVHNDIASLENIRIFLFNTFPHARIAICHGQMPETEIERVMIDFTEHHYDILISTTIIENGIDIPNVNTLVVNNAENFGLSQLYQLRGRVGRSYRQAYAYFFHAPMESLTEKARKRLFAIRDFADLGSGYKLAMKDLEIRGAGNILGAEQHGCIAEVGFHLYCQMLAETVSQFKGEPVRIRENAEIDFAADAYIPDDYIEDLPRRTAFYKRITACTNDDYVDDIATEMRDRYGELPPQLLRLFKCQKISARAVSFGINKIRTMPKLEYTDILFADDDSRVRFSSTGYPANVMLEVDHMQDRTRVTHRGLPSDMLIDEFLKYMSFAEARLT